MSGVNKAIVIGNLGAEPELRYTPNGTAVANISVATSERWKDKQTGEQQERTEWHRIVCWNRLGEIVGEYLHKGSKVYVEGSLQTRKWQGQDGQDRYTTEIVARQMQMLDSRHNHGDGQRSQSGPASQRSAQAYQQASRGTGYAGNTPQRPQQAPQPAGIPGFDDDLNDDIPFS